MASSLGFSVFDAILSDIMISRIHLKTFPQYTIIALKNIWAICIFGILCSCSPLQAQHPIYFTTTRIAKTNLIGLARSPLLYCAPDVPSNFPGPQKIVVTDSALLDDLCALGFKNRVIAATGPIPVYLQRIYPHILHQIPDKADIVLQISEKNPPLHSALHAVTIASQDWKERLYLLAQYLGVEKTATAALTDYAHYSAQTSTLLDTQDTEVSLVTIKPETISLLGRSGFTADVLADANVGRPDRINFDQPQNISLHTLSLADADVIYITYPSSARSTAQSILESQEWSQLGAAIQHRQFIVNYSWWNQGNGLLAARSILDDLRASLNFTS